MVCKEQGRHVHIDWCLTQPGEICGGVGFQHIDIPMQPNPSREKDRVTHDLYWRRTGTHPLLTLSDVQTNELRGVGFKGALLSCLGLDNRN